MPGCDRAGAGMFLAYAPEEYPVYRDYQGDKTGDPGGEQTGGSKGDPQ